MCYLKAQVVPSMLMRTGVSRETPVTIKLLASIIADSVRMLTGASREAPVYNCRRRAIYLRYSPNRAGTVRRGSYFSSIGSLFGF